MKFITRTALAVALSTIAISAFAIDGFAGDISFDKPEYKVHDTVIMSLGGMGLCKNFVADWGDGVKTPIMAYYFNNDGPLHLQHKYTTAGTFYPTIKQITGPTLPEQCGSRSSSVKILATGTVTGVTALPAQVLPNAAITVTVNGSGQCAVPMSIVYNNQPINSKDFAADAPWPRVATFTLPDEGKYYFNVYNHIGSSYAGNGGCSISTQPMVEVKKLQLINPGLVLPVQTVNTMPAIKPVRSGTP